MGQEKVRPLTGFQTVAFASDWVRPTRHQAATPFFALLSGQWRYADVSPERLASPLGRGAFRGMHIADMNALGARLGWLPSFPSFDRSSLDLVDEAERAGVDPAEFVVAELREGRLRFACEDPDASQNHPRVMTVWRANLLGSSGKGHEYFLKHMLGAAEPGVRAEEAAPEHRPRDVTWREAPDAKLDLFTTIDFRMTSNALFSDVVLPAATWYEKHDLSTTDLHPFVHTFNPAIPPPWEARTDWDSFKAIAEKFSQLAKKHLGVRRDVIAAPLAHTDARSRFPAARPSARLASWGVRAHPGKDHAQTDRGGSATTPMSPLTTPLSARSPRRSERASKALRGSRCKRSSGWAAKTGWYAAEWRTAGLRSTAWSTPARRSWHSPVRQTAGSHWKGFGRSRSAAACHSRRWLNRAQASG